MKYAAYDDCSIYALGFTPTEAVENARREAKDWNARFKVGKVDDAFAKEIEELGWNGNVDAFREEYGWLKRIRD